MVWDRFWMDLMDIGWIYACLIDFEWILDGLGKILDGCLMDFGWVLD